jgi:type IV secretory pathway VirB2 component (pilin)
MHSILGQLSIVSGLLLLSILVTAEACGGHQPWERTVQLKGRRRSLLSLQHRR